MPATTAGLVAVEYQLKNKTSAIAMAGCCKYGYPQAIMLSPNHKKKRFSSHLTRLTCPLMVKEIDEWEAKGGVVEQSEALLPEHEEDLASVNERHARTREKLMTPETIRAGKKQLGDNFQIAMSSGLAGLAQTDDVKCLHAQAADALLSGNNPIGDKIIAQLQNPTGDDVCHQQCSGQGPWAYYSAKNKQKLRTTRERRKAMAQAAREKQKNEA